MDGGKINPGAKKKMDEGEWEGTNNYLK